MNFHVLDASVLIRLFCGDGPMPTGLLEVARDADVGHVALAAPELIWVETAHVVQRKVSRGEIARSERAALWRAMRRAPIDLLPIVQHIDRALALSDALKISVYDALYLSVAEHLKARLWTADEELKRAALVIGLEAS